METRAALITRLELEVIQHEERALRERLQARGKRLQLDELRSDTQAPTRLAEMTHTDAIEQVLRQEGPKGPTELRALLVEAGRVDPGRSVNGILESLREQGRVEKVRRGVWAAVT
jgi:hypothetical protein